MEGDDYVDDPLDRIEVADILAKGERLTELRESVRVELDRIKPEAVVLLGSIARNLSYNAAAERAALETIVRLVAQDLHVACDRLSPPTVSARLGLGRSGAFGDQARRFFTHEHPPFWAERCKAAAVAVAWQRA